MVPATETKARPRQKPLPGSNREFCQLAETVKPSELSVMKQVRWLVAASFALWDIRG